MERTVSASNVLVIMVTLGLYKGVIEIDPCNVL